MALENEKYIAESTVDQIEKLGAELIGQSAGGSGSRNYLAIAKGLECPQARSLYAKFDVAHAAISRAGQ